MSYFVVLKKLKTQNFNEFYDSIRTSHTAERLDRFKAYGELDLLKDAKFVDTFLVDKAHKDGNEIHSITNTGLIVIFNENSGRLITVLAARPGQIKRYYKYPYPVYIDEIVKIAFRNMTVYNANNL